MALPKEPRQKMINIMYLVLTALLALNVSAEILNAFKTVDRSLMATNATVNHSTETILASLEEKKSDPSSAVKATIWLPKAQQAQALTKDLYNYIQELKNEIYKESGLDVAKNHDSTYKMDDLDVATRVLVEGKKKGAELQKKLADYKQALLNIDPLIAQEMKNSLQINLDPPPTEDKSNKTWEAAYFHMVPSVAAITILSKFQNDIKTSENKVVAFCHEQVGKVTVRFDTYAAIIGQSSNYLMPGQQIEINAGVGAFSKAAQPQITIGGRPAPLGENGAATLKLDGGGVGAHSIPVHIVYKDQDGKDQVIDRKIDYMVGQSNASIALDKMNVLYIGVDNPVSIAASGGGSDKVQASIAGGGGSIQSVGQGKYIVRVSQQTDDAKISVSVDGKLAGVSSFRVRSIPPASAFIGGFESGANVGASAFKAQAGVSAGIKNFPFELKYQVVSFDISCDNDDGDVDQLSNQGNTWNPRVQSMLQKNVKSGRLVTVDNIRVLGPDGKTSKAPSLVYYIK